jgi:hypothetical protein
MELKYKQGDLIEAFADGCYNVIIQQCNFIKGLGAGIAKKIADRYPKVAKQDFNIRKSPVEDILGQAMSIDINNTQRIYNVYSQYYTGSPKKDFDTFEQRCNWLRNGLSQIAEYASKEDKFVIPLIASGLAASKQLKGTMSDLEYFKQFIAPIVEEELKDLDVTVYYL